jgi:hypothetical protein
MHAMNQVARNEELLNTARGCFHFVVEFFEPINASATHIYHSALELSPLSSIVRRLYYHQRHTPLPRVLTGTWDSWDQGTAISGTCGNYGYCSYTWSPCGQFVATHAGGYYYPKIVEIRNGVTLQLLSTLTTPDTYLVGGPSYSPDGSSLASLTNTSLIIWDIQTGGMTKEIGHNSTKDVSGVSLVWSLDGGTVGTIFHDGDSEIWTMHTNDITSGTTLSSITLQSRDNPHIWAHNTSFQVMTTGWDGQAPTINIFEVGSTLTKIKSFQINLWATTGWAKSSQEEPFYEIKSFSPTTYHISIGGGDSFAILDIQSSECLLEQKGQLKSDCFSFDGSLYAAHWINGDSIHIWKHTSGHYTQWKELPLQKSNSIHSCPPYFSPTLSSILSCSLDTHSLWVWQLDDSPPTTPSNDPTFFATPHCCDTYMVASYKGNSTVTITNPLSQTPCHFIDTGMEIKALVHTGNILLVMDSTTIAAWKLTKEGLVVGAVGKGRASLHDSIWTVMQPNSPKFAVKDQIAFICGGGETILYIYSTETGGGLDLTQATLPGRWCFNPPGCVGLENCHSHPENKWPNFMNAMWIKDLDGKHQLWIPVKWRPPGVDNIRWLHHVETLWFTIEDKPVAIKF